MNNVGAFKTVFGIIKNNSISVGSDYAIENAKIVWLKSSNVRLMMTESTILFMFNLNQCIELALDQLVGIVEKVDTKFPLFSNIASTASDAKDVSNVICASDYFDKNQLLDYVIVSCSFLCVRKNYVKEKNYLKEI